MFQSKYSAVTPLAKNGKNYPVFTCCTPHHTNEVSGLLHVQSVDRSNIQKFNVNCPRTEKLS